MGLFVAINTTDLGAGINGRNPVSYDFENIFGMNRNTFSGVLNFNARFGKHNRLDFSYYNLYRASTATLQKDIQFGEHDYPLNSTVKTHLNTNVFRISYGYSFFSNLHWEAGALIGLHAMFFNTGLNLKGNTVDESFKDNANFNWNYHGPFFTGVYKW